MVTVLRDYLERQAKARVAFSPTEEERQSEEYRLYAQAWVNYQNEPAETRGAPPRDFLKERKIDKALEGLPFVIEATSTDEKSIMYERISFLLNSKVGIELLSNAESLAARYGKITIKETPKDGDIGGYVSEKEPLIVHVNPLLRDKLNTETSLSSDKENNWIYQEESNYLWQNRAAKILAHEIWHVLQLHHPDCNVSTSFENAAKKDLMEEIGAKIMGICYEAEKGISNPETDIYHTYKAIFKKMEGLNEKQAERRTRELIVFLHLINARGMGDDFESELKEEIYSWNEKYKRQALCNACWAKITSDPESIRREQNYMNYLCDSIGVDRNILKTLADVFDEDRKDGKIIIGGRMYSEEKKKGQCVVEETRVESDGEFTVTFINGKRVSTLYLDTETKRSIFTTFYPDGKTIKSERLDDPKRGSKIIEHDKQGRKIKEITDWNGKKEEKRFNPIMGERLPEEPESARQEAGEKLFNRLKNSSENLSEKNGLSTTLKKGMKNGSFFRENLQKKR